MNKITAYVGTLAVAGTFIAGTAMADTSTTNASAAKPKLLDKMVLSYWAAYYGPSISNPNAFTFDGSKRGAVGKEGDQGLGGGGELQNLDSTITLGYKITDKLILAGNYRFVIRPSNFGGPIEGGNPFIYRNKDPWINLVAPKLVHAYGFNVSADIRFYIPVVSNPLEYSAIRLTQTTTYDVPKTRLTVGVWTFERANFLTDAGAAGGMENLSFVVAGLASYQLTPTLAATLWTDVVQATYSNAAGDVPLGWDNSAMDLSLGIGWDITPKININPQITFFPGFPSLQNTTIGGYISAKVL